MAKFYGKIGYSITQETSPGIWNEEITVREHVGDLMTNSARWQTSDSTNDDLVLNNKISIIADEFAFENHQLIKYVEFKGAKWRVTNVEFLRPRLILTLGGVYNG